MEYTREQVATRALRLIGVCAMDEPPTADMMEGALITLDSLYAELCVEAQPTWDVAASVPSVALVPLAQWLGAELAGEYGVGSPMKRGAAMLRVLSIVRTDDCVDDCGNDPCADYGRGAAKVVYIPDEATDWNVGAPVYSEI